MSPVVRLAVIVLAVLIAVGCSDRLEGKFGEELFQDGCAQCQSDMEESN